MSGDTPADTGAALLAGSELAARIVAICRGKDVEVAVAFWGGGAADALFGSRSAARRSRILCDVSLGGTQAKALEELGAPDNKKLRHRRALHAKLYISDQGVVIGSANASRAALGFGGDPQHIELGTYHSPSTPVWSAARAWFKIAYRDALKVDDDALTRARLAWRAPPPSFESRSGSLLDAVRLSPDRYRGLGFYFEKIALNEDEACEHRAASVGSANTKHDKTVIRNCRTSNIFTGLSEREVRDTPQLFIEFWRPDASRLRIIARRVEYRDVENRTLYTSRQAHLVRRRLDGLFPTLEAAARLDDEAAHRLLARRNRGVRFLSADEMLAAFAFNVA